MPKLKALRGAVGSYGRVAAGGIVEVDEPAASKLLKTGRFVRATDQDIAAAQKAQKAVLAAQTPGTGAAFMPMPDAPSSDDRLSQMVQRGEISRDKAKEFASLQIALSTDEVQAFIQEEGDRIKAEVAAAQEGLDARDRELDQRAETLQIRDQELDEREAELAEREAELAERESALAALEKELDARANALADREKAVEADSKAAEAKPKAKAEKAEK